MREMLFEVVLSRGNCQFNQILQSCKVQVLHTRVSEEFTREVINGSLAALVISKVVNHIDDFGPKVSRTINNLASNDIDNSYCKTRTNRLHGEYGHLPGTLRVARVFNQR